MFNVLTSHRKYTQTDSVWTLTHTHTLTSSKWNNFSSSFSSVCDCGRSSDQWIDPPAHLSTKLWSVLLIAPRGLGLPHQPSSTVYWEVDRTPVNTTPSWWIARPHGMIVSAFWRSEVRREIYFYSFNLSGFEKEHQQWLVVVVGLRKGNCAGNVNKSLGADANINLFISISSL